LKGSSHPLKERSRQGEKLSFFHEAVVENWSNKDFTFAYSVSSSLVVLFFFGSIAPALLYVSEFFILYSVLRQVEAR
jgi:hypothetical protein